MRQPAAGGQQVRYVDTHPRQIAGFVTRHRMPGASQRSEVESGQQERDEFEAEPPYLGTRTGKGQQRHGQRQQKPGAQHDHLAEDRLAKDHKYRPGAQRPGQRQTAHFHCRDGKPASSRYATCQQAEPHEPPEPHLALGLRTGFGAGSSTCCGRQAGQASGHPEGEQDFAKQQQCRGVVDSAENKQRGVHGDIRRVPEPWVADCGRKQWPLGLHIKREVALIDVGVHRQHTPVHAVFAGASSGTETSICLPPSALTCESSLSMGWSAASSTWTLLNAGSRRSLNHRVMRGGAALTMLSAAGTDRSILVCAMAGKATIKARAASGNFLIHLFMASLEEDRSETHISSKKGPWPVYLTRFTKNR